MKKCSDWEMEMMDVFYGEAEMSASCQAHLATCQACREFYESLTSLPAEISEEIKIDEWVIQQSVQTALEQFEKRNKRERWIFFVATLGFLTLGFGLLTSGFGTEILNAYLVIYLAGPLFLPVIIWKRQTGRREHA